MATSTTTSAASIDRGHLTARGTQARPARLREVTTADGVDRFREAARTPFTIVFEVRT